MDYRYRRTDFGPLDATLDHIESSLAFLEDRVVVAAALTVRALQPLSVLRLNARELDVDTVALAGARAQAVQWEYRASENAILVTLPKPMAPGERIRVATRTTCRPAANLLEGIYKDVTPPGCPQQYVSQCQQWGFQRIMPVIDDCRAKCTFTTTIEADARYTHLISNGNVCRRRNPGGTPLPVDGNASRLV